jgi:hypothetical protein
VRLDVLAQAHCGKGVKQFAIRKVHSASSSSSGAENRAATCA